MCLRYWVTMTVVPALTTVFLNDKVSPTEGTPVLGVQCRCDPMILLRSYTSRTDDDLL